ncbi:MAG: hypothetical protein ACJ751_02030 [Niastella sp.]|jgi:hypothetical protein|uniref:hypothetical protein n=1 Tax=Niastella sp. TaxID=1869183 RepID=UPI003899E295
MKADKIEKDIKIFYVTAKSFPDGIQDAHDRLHTMVPFSKERKYFGISRPENGKIIYRVGTEETFAGESEKYQCDTLIIKSGNYVSTVVEDFRKDKTSISKAFEELLKQPNLDPEGYCVEWYANDKEEVKCMIRLNQ